MFLWRILLSKQAVAEQGARVYEMHLLITNLEQLYRAISPWISETTWHLTPLHSLAGYSKFSPLADICSATSSHLQQISCLGHILWSRKWLFDLKNWMNYNKEFLRVRSLDPNADILLERSHLTSFTSRIDILFCALRPSGITKHFPLPQYYQRSNVLCPHPTDQGPESANLR